MVSTISRCPLSCPWVDKDSRVSTILSSMHNPRPSRCETIPPTRIFSTSLFLIRETSNQIMPSPSRILNRTFRPHAHPTSYEARHRHPLTNKVRWLGRLRISQPPPPPLSTLLNEPTLRIVANNIGHRRMATMSSSVVR